MVALKVFLRFRPALKALRWASVTGALLGCDDERGHWILSLVLLFSSEPHHAMELSSLCATVPDPGAKF